MKEDNIMKKSIALVITLVLLSCSISSAFAVNSSSSYKQGDVNQDGYITVSDVTYIQKVLAQLVEISGEALECADVNGDRYLSVADGVCIQKYITRVIDKFPAEKTEDNTSETEQTTTVPTTQPTTESTTEPTTKPNDDSSQAYGTPNEFEMEIFNIVNRYRAEEGLKPLKFGNFYYQCGKLRAKEVNGYFSHYRPDNTPFDTVFDDFGFDYLTCGENIACNINDAETVMTAFMNSPAHRANILQKEYEYVVIAVCESEKYPGYYSVEQLFYTPFPD